MDLWLPPTADLGEHAGPEPDRRMQNFTGGLDQAGQPKPMTYQRLRQHARSWPTTQATPDGPASLLLTARKMFAHGFYEYEFFAAACSFSIFAVEAALKVRLNGNGTLGGLIKRAQQQGLITRDQAEILDAGRQIRNGFVHEGTQPAWLPAMAGSAIGASHNFVAELYPDG